MRKLDKRILLEEQRKLDEINRSGNYSFKQTIDENGHIHVDCDAETYIREMGLIPLEEHITHLNFIVDKEVSLLNCDKSDYMTVEEAKQRTLAHIKQVY